MHNIKNTTEWSKSNHNEETVHCHDDDFLYFENQSFVLYGEVVVIDPNAKYMVVAVNEVDKGQYDLHFNFYLSEQEADTRFLGQLVELHYRPVYDFEEGRMELVIDIVTTMTTRNYKGDLDGQE